MKRLIPALCLAGAVLFWGTSFVGTKIALDTFTPMTIIWMRLVLASALFVPLVLRLPRPEYRPGDWKWFLLLSVLQPCLYYLFEGYAVLYTTSSQAGVISAIVPLLVAAGAWAFLRERLSPRAVIAIAVSLGGVAALSFGGTAQASAPNPLLGNSLEFFAMVSAAGSMLAVKHLTSRYNPWVITGVQNAVGAAFFLPGALASGPANWVHAPLLAWGTIAYLGIFVSLIAFGLYNTAVSLIPASRAALSINLIPAVAMLAGWLIRGESLSPIQLVACAVIVGAVVFGESGEAPAEEPAEPPLEPEPTLEPLQP